MKRLAASTVAMPASASSLTRRSWRVPKARSERPPRLGGVGGDVLDAELVQGAPDLAAPPLVHLAAGLGRVEVVAAAVGIQRAGQAVLGEHRLERPEGGRGAFLLDQEGRVDLRGGVVQGDDQVERRPARQPRMTRAVLMQHHADAGLARPPPAMRPAPRRPRYQTRPLQHRPGPAVAQGEAVMLAQMVVEVLDRPADMAGAVLLQHPLDPIHRHPPRRPLAEPAVEQAVQTFLFVAPPVAPEAALRHPQKLGRIQRRQTLRLVASQNIAKLLHPPLL